MLRLKSIVGSVNKGENGQLQFDWLGTRNKKNVARQTADYMQALQKYAHLTNKDEVTAMFADFANIKGMQEEASALRNLVGDTDAYNKKLVEIRTNKEAAIKSTTGFSGALKTLGGVAKTVGASLLQMGAMFLASIAVNAVVDQVDKQINAVKYAKEALAEYANEWDELAEKQKSAGELVSKYEADYERLSKGVNMVTGENLALSDDEYELFKQINAELADSALASVQGITLAYDEQGNAIVRLSDQMDNLSEAYGQLEKQTRADIIKGFEDAYPQAQIALGGNATSVGIVGRQQINADLQSLIASAESYEQAVASVEEYLRAGYEQRGHLTGPAFIAEAREAWGVPSTSDAQKASDNFVDNLVGLVDDTAGTYVTVWADKQHALFDPNISQTDTISLLAQVIVGTPYVGAMRASAHDTDANAIIKDLWPGLKALVQEEISNGEFGDLSQSSMGFLVDTAIQAIPAEEFSKISMSEFRSKVQEFAQAFADGTTGQQALNALLSGQTQYAKGDLTFGAWKDLASENARQLQASGNMLPGFQELVDDTFGTGIDGFFATVERRLLGGATDSGQTIPGMFSDATREWIDSQTADQINFAMGLNYGEDRQISREGFERLYSRTQESQKYSAANDASQFAKQVEAQKTLDEIIKAQGYSTSLTAEQYAKLVEAGEDYAACVKNVNGYMQLDIEAAHKLAQAKAKETQATVEAGKAYKLQQYGENLENLRYLNTLLESKQELDAQEIEIIEDKIQAIESEQDAIKSDIDAYNRLGSEIAFATSSYKKWLDAQEAPEAGDAYADMLTAMGQIKEGQESGKIGTAKYKAAVELLVPDGKDVDVYLQTLGKYLTEDSKGLQQFIDDMFAQGFLSKGANGMYSFMQGTSVEDIAQGLGLTKELTQYMLQALEDYGWDVDIFNTQFGSDDALRRQEEAVKNLQLKEEELKRLREDVTASAEAIAQAEKDVLDAQAEVAAADAVLVDVPKEDLSAIERLEADLVRLQTLYDELGALELGGTVDTKFATDIATIQDVLAKIMAQPEDGYKVKITNDGELATAQADITKMKNALTAIDALANAGVISYSVAAELSGSITAQMTTLENEITAYNNGKKKLTVSTQLSGQAKQDLTDLEQGVYTAKLGVELDPVQEQAVRDKLEALRASAISQDARIAESSATLEQTTQDLDAAVVRFAADGQMSDEELEEFSELLSTVRQAIEDTQSLTEEIYTQANAAVAAVPELEESVLRTKRLMKAVDEAIQREQEAQAAVDAANQNVLTLSQVATQRADEIQTLSTEYWADGEVTADEQAQMDAWNAELTQLSEQLVKKYAELDTAMSTWEQRHTETVAQQKAVDEQLGVTEVPVEADTEDAEAEVEAFVSSVNEQQATIQIKTQLSGGPDTTAGSISATVGGAVRAAAGLAFAQGTKNAPEEDAMVGDGGIETVITDGHFYTVGHDGPEIVHLNKGDQVLTTQETKKLFGRNPRRFGRAYEDGRGSWLTNSVASVTGGVLGLVNLLNLSGGGGDLGGGKGGKSASGPNYAAILDKFEKLHDWIVRALEVAEKKTQSLIDSVKDFVGYIAQNKQVDKALKSTRDEIELNQQAYVRYMQQAAEVQDQLDLSDEIVKKIHEGIIDIEEYDETTKKKIAEYQEWYEKAEATLDTIKDLKEQERELQLQRMDNIIADYDNRMDYLDDESARIQREIELQKAIGAEVQEKSYEKLIEGERRQVATLQRERAALEAEFNALVAAGVLQVGSEDWHKYRNELEGIDEAIHDATIGITEFADEIYNLRLDKLQAIASTLQNIQASTEGIMSLHDAQGAKNVQEYYDTLISNGHAQISNLEAQNDLIRTQMEGLELGSEKYQALLEELRGNEQAITDIKVSQEQWNDAIADLSIADLEDQRKALEKTNDQYQKQLEYEEAQEALAKAKNQRTKLLYIEGQGFQYVADQQAIDEAQKRVDELDYQAKLDAIDDQIEKIEDAKAEDNVWSYDGATLLKQNGVMPAEVAEAIQDMLSAALLPDNYTQTRYLENLNTGAQGAAVAPISIGDIYVSGVDNAEGLAKDIVQNLPNAILQEWRKGT